MVATELTRCLPPPPLLLPLLPLPSSKEEEPLAARLRRGDEGEKADCDRRRGTSAMVDPSKKPSCEDENDDKTGESSEPKPSLPSPLP